MTPTLTGSAASAELAASTIAAATARPGDFLWLRFDLVSIDLSHARWIRSFLQRDHVALVDRRVRVDIGLDHALAAIPRDLALDIFHIEVPAFVDVAERGLQRLGWLVQIFGQDGENRRSIGAL